MPLTVQNLDNRTFEDLVAEAKSLIPVYAPQWTNYNPSDPGITLIELFAWLCEMIIYRVDQVPNKNYISFLKLLGVELMEDEKLPDGIRRAVEQLSERYIAVTASDYELLAQNGLLEKPGIFNEFPDLSVRTICLVNRDLERFKTDEATQFGHISILLLLKTENIKDLLKEMAEIKKYVRDSLGAKKLLTTRIHVVEPDYQEVNINIVVSAKDKGLKDTIEKAISSYLDPMTGGEENKGWKPGRSVYTSDIYHLVEGINGVDHVVSIDLTCPKVKKFQLFKLKELLVEVE